MIVAAVRSSGKLLGKARREDFVKKQFHSVIVSSIDEISTRAAKLRLANVQFRDFTQPVPQGYDNQKIVNEIGTQTTWFTDRLVGFGAKKKFTKYLDIS